MLCAVCYAVSCVGLGGFTTCGVFAPQSRGGRGGGWLLVCLRGLKKKAVVFLMWHVEVLLDLSDDASAMPLSVGCIVLSLGVIEEDTSACVHQPSTWST